MKRKSCVKNQGNFLLFFLEFFLLFSVFSCPQICWSMAFVFCRIMILDRLV